MVKNSRRAVLCILLGIFISITAVIDIQTVHAHGEQYLPNESTMVYSISSTATYRSYDDNIRITVTDNVSWPNTGKLEYVSEDNDIWTAIEDKPVETNQILVPFVINVSTKEVGMDNCSYYGLNDSRSYLIESWTAENLVWEGIDRVFADDERSCVQLTYEYNFTHANRLNTSLTDELTSTNTLYWDLEYGILLESETEIDNLNDSSMDGTVKTTLVVTSLWSLIAEGIPGFPVLPVGIITVIGITGLILGAKNKTRRNFNEI